MTKHSFKPRPYIIESRWNTGKKYRDWTFHRKTATLEHAKTVIERNKAMAKFLDYRIIDAQSKAELYNTAN